MAIKFYTQECEYKLKRRAAIKATIAQCLADEGFTAGEVSVVFCSDEYLLGVNKQFLDHHYSTDIITFDYTDYDSRIVSGDLFISVDTVATNAVQFGVTADLEMARVVIHGVLHLTGQGDKTDEEQKIMTQKEDKYLDILANL